VQKVIQQLESVRRLAQSLNGGGESQIKILITPSLATNVLPRALSAFRNKFPKISISIRTLHSGEIAKAIALQEGDVGIVYGSQGHPALIEEKIAVGKLVYLSGAGRGGIGRKTISLEEVVRNPFIRIHENDHLGAMLAAQCLHLGYRLEGGIAVQTHHIAMVLAEQGFGPAVVDSFTAFTSKTKLDLKILMPEIPVEICSLISRGAGLANSSAFFIEAFKAVASTHWFDADD
jgi:DNA-binding transcriptional LysR family regulator